MVWERLGSASVSGSTANTSWKELGRQTLSSSGDVMTSGTFTAKDNLMILYYGVASGEMINKLTFNDDTGNNYAYKISDNGASDSSTTSNAFLEFATSSTSNEFSVADVVNIADQEKLVHLNHAGQNTAGAGTSPRSRELAGKWANTSNAITKVTATNSQSGSFGSGSELIVLGYDNDEADTGSNFWQELASVTRTDSGSTLESGNFAAKKYLMVEACTIPANNGFKGRLEFGHSNGTMDTGSNYADRYEQDGGSDSAQTSNNYIYAYTNHDDNIQHLKMFIVNKSDKEKLVLWWASSGGSSTGAGNAPQRRNGVAKWTNTSNQITNIRLNNQVAGGDAASGSFIKVYGAD